MIEIINSLEYKTKIGDIISKYIIGKIGLEIGGPSIHHFGNTKYFGGDIFNIYDNINILDGLNFSDNNIWTGQINKNDGNIVNGKSLGEQYILEGTDLKSINKTYDFVASSNVIEHSANPLKFIENSLLVLKKDGILITIAPNKEDNFDHKRSVVDFQHLIDDYNNNIGEEDLTHYEEIVSLHDRNRDPWIIGTFEDRCKKNYENRCMHHHVFDLNVLHKIYEYFNLKIIYSIKLTSDFLIIGIK